MSAPPPVQTNAAPPRVNPAPIVSPDSNSPEAKMARSSKAIQLQLATDTQYDQVAPYAYESFKDINQNLLLLAIAAVFMTIVSCTR
jgi:hypothetical protein